MTIRPSITWKQYLKVKAKVTKKKKLWWFFNSKKNVKNIFFACKIKWSSSKDGKCRGAHKGDGVAKCWVHLPTYCLCGSERMLWHGLNYTEWKENTIMVNFPDGRILDLKHSFLTPYTSKYIRFLPYSESSSGL